MALTKPLSDAEREDFRQLFEKRLEKVAAKTDDLFAFKTVKEPPYVVNSALYWLFGLDMELFPDDYFAEPAAMVNFQEQTYYNQVKEIEDDFVPYLMPWFGTVVAASAFGCQIEFFPKQDPAANPRFYPVKTPEDIRQLEVPDPEKAGLMPRVLEFLRYMKANSFLPVGITDFQGPLTTANQLMGYDQLIYLMYDYPNRMHELMDKVTEALIQWVKKQKQVIGEPLDRCISDQQVYLGRHGGVWFSDDDAVLMSDKLYREFVVPYNSRILSEFGGGIIHYCGNATHHAVNFLNTKGLLGLNVYMLYNVPSFAKLKEKVGDRLVLFACDYTPVDYGSYFEELLSSVDPKGMLICSQYSPVVGLIKGGKYNEIRRPLAEGRRDVYECLRSTIQRHAVK
ncbi:MAG TPA: uroporphyrinogen decarboxylase family protein [Anaerolineales bacterium]